MKKNLRMFCLGLAAASCLTGFAQVENVTSKLQNADFEWGVAYWDVTFENQIWGKQTSKSGATGFYGFSGANLEVWNGSVLKPNSVSQTVAELPNGTYVFGAYVGASYRLTEPTAPTKEEGMTDEEFRKSAEYKAWLAQRDNVRAILVADSVFGVSMFANETVVPVATEHPDFGTRAKHTVKYNVATKVTDGKLTVGLNVDSTNVSYVTWDGIELYYCGNMEAEAALNEVAKINAQQVLAIADTVKVRHMNADSLAFLNEGIAAAKAVATAADFTAADELLRWGIVMGNKSANDYKRLANRINLSKELIASKDDWFYEDQLAATQAVVDYADEVYADAAAARTEINQLIDSLVWSCAMLKFDLLELANEELGDFNQQYATQFGDGEGQFPTYWQDSLEALYAKVANVIEDFSAETAVEDVNWIDVIYNSMEACLNSANGPGAGGAFRPQTLTGDPALGENLGNDVYKYQSETFTSNALIESIRVTFLDTYCPNGAGKGDPVFVALSEFYLYDGAGNQVALTVDNFSTNAQEPNEGPMANICDGNTDNFWHSAWSSNVSNGAPHYLEISVPLSAELTSFSIGWQSRNNRQNIPASVELSIVTTGSKYQSALTAEVAKATAFLSTVVVGKGVGYSVADLTALQEAIAAGDALLDKANATDDEYKKAAAAIEDAQYEVDMAGVVLPEEGKKYRIVSAGPFFGKQNVQKALSVRNDTLWWETAHIDSVQQEFVLEVMPNEDDMLYYRLLNVESNLYLNSGTGDYHPLTADEDTVELIPLGAGQFALKAHGTGVFHACDHNSGNLGNGWTGDVYGQAGGLFGDYSRVIPYGDADRDGASAWYICELNTLPLTALVEGGKFTSVDYHFYKPVSVFTIKADKKSEFKDLTFYGLDGVAMEDVTLDPAENGFLVSFPTAVSGFIFSFDNAEGVSKVEFIESNLAPLREAYKEAVDFAPVFSDSIGHYGDATEYEAALAQAEEYFAKGATDAQVEAAIKALEAAVANLKPNMPAADKTYYFINSVPEFAKNHDVPVAIYAKNQVADGVEKTYAKWAYISLNNNAYHWRFIEVETAPEDSIDVPVYKIQNVATEKYVANLGGNNEMLELTSDQEAAGNYTVKIMRGTFAAIGNIKPAAEKGAIDTYDYLHAAGHSNGAGKAGNIVRWEAGAGASQWSIVEAEAVLTDIDFTEIEDENDEAVSAKGIYDLFGRRVINPTAAGIYIIDGKKRVIK